MFELTRANVQLLFRLTDPISIGDDVKRQFQSLEMAVRNAAHKRTSLNPSSSTGPMGRIASYPASASSIGLDVSVSLLVAKRLRCLEYF